MKTIMVVDDEIMITKTLSLLLKMKTKENVIVYNTPREALESIELRNKKIDVIISDFIMPGMNGIEFLLEVKKIAPRTETILLTGYADKENAIRSINEVGVYYYLEKPWNNEELVKIVSNAIEKKHLSESLEAKIYELERSSIENKRLYELVSNEYTMELEGSKSLMVSLANVIEAKDTYTDGHTRRVSVISKRLGRVLNLTPHEIDILEIAGIIHDVGKVGIPEEILNKPGKLTEEEFLKMKDHPSIGEKICKPLNALKDFLSPIRHHHEKLNGTGYPDGLKGDAIDIITRILSVSDIFDALFSDRPYRSRLPLEKVKHIMFEEANANLIDLQVVTELFRLIETNQMDDIIA